MVQAELEAEYNIIEVVELRDDDAVDYEDDDENKDELRDDVKTSRAPFRSYCDHINQEEAERIALEEAGIDPDEVEDDDEEEEVDDDGEYEYEYEDEALEYDDEDDYGATILDVKKSDGGAVADVEEEMGGNMDILAKLSDNTLIIDKMEVGEDASEDEASVDSLLRRLDMPEEDMGVVEKVYRMRSKRGMTLLVQLDSMRFRDKIIKSSRTEAAR